MSSVGGGQPNDGEVVPVVWHDHSATLIRSDEPEYYYMELQTSCARA